MTKDSGKKVVPESREAQVLGASSGISDVSCWIDRSALDDDRGSKSDKGSDSDSDSGGRRE